MANVIDQLALLITANADGAINVIRQFGQTSTAELESVEQKAAQAGTGAGNAFGSGLQNTALAGFATLAATATAFKAVSFSKDSIQAAVDYNRATAAVNATLLATGNAANTSGSGIERLAQQIQSVDAIFEGTVKQGASLLLTFKDIQNAPGAGNNIFDRTLKTAAAVSVVFDKDITTSVLQVGRALENPLNNMQALSRTGLALSSVDKQRVTDLAKQGDLIGAQNALLDALQNKGLLQQAAAIAKADPLAQFNVASQEFKKTVGEDLLPLASKVLETASGIFKEFEKFPAPLRTTVELVAGASALLLPFLSIGKVIGSLGAIAANTAPKEVSRAVGNDAAIASEKNLTAAVTEEAVAAESAVASNEALGAELTGLAARGDVAAESLGVAGTQLSLFADAGTLFGADVAAGGGQIALLEADLESLPVALDDVNSGFFVAGAGSRTFAVSMGGAAEESRLFAVDLAGTAQELRLFSVGMTGIAEEIGSTAGEITFIDASLAELTDTTALAAHGLTGVGARVAQEMLLAERALAGTGEQLGLFSEGIDAVAVGLGPADEQLALFNDTLAVTQVEADAAYVALNRLAAAEVAVGGPAVGEGIGLALGGAGAASLGGRAVSNVALGGEGEAALGGAGAASFLGGRAVKNLALGGEGAAALGGAATAIAPIAPEVTASVTGLSGALGASLPVIGAFALGAVTLNSTLDSMGDKAPKLDALSHSLETFFKTGKPSGTLQTTLSNIDPRIGDIISREKGANQAEFGGIPIASQLGGLGQKIGNFLTGKQGEINSYKASVNALDQQMAQLTESGNIQDANQLFQELVGKLHLNSDQFPQFKAALDDWTASAVAAKGGALDLELEFGRLGEATQSLEASLKITDSFDAITAAADKVAGDKADIAGTSDKAKQATQAEADAYNGVATALDGVDSAKQQLADSYISLQDAQDRVTSSAHSLAEAQQQLNDFLSPRGQRERSLQLDIINRRVVTTPEGEDQKQLDLLQFDDNNKNKLQSLQDSVTNGLKQQRDAIKGVGDAERAITQNQQAVLDANQKVVAAEDNFTSSIKKRKAVHDDAKKALVSDERQQQEAILNTIGVIQQAIDKGDVNNGQLVIWGRQLEGLSGKYAPGSPLSKSVDQFYQKVLQYQISVAAGNNFGIAGATTDPKTGVVTKFGTPGTYSSPPGQGVNAVGLAGPLGPSGIKPVPPALQNLPPEILKELGYANGGIEHHIAQIDRAATHRTWAEPETGGEAYIPLSPAKRGTSMDILSQVAGEFGYRLERYANGGISIANLAANFGSLGSGDDQNPYFPKAALPDAGSYVFPKLTGTHQVARTAATQSESRDVRDGTVVHVTNNFNSKSPSEQDLEYANRQLGWRLSRAGRY